MKSFRLGLDLINCFARVLALSRKGLDIYQFESLLIAAAGEFDIFLRCLRSLPDTAVGKRSAWARTE